MAETYHSEQRARTRFVERTRQATLDALSQSVVRDALGPLATSLTTLAEGMYVPDVSLHGAVSIPVTKRGSDALPVLALREHEVMLRDGSFAAFSPRQIASTPEAQRRYFAEVCKRAEALPQQEFLTGFKDLAAASARRMIYRIPNFPKAGEDTNFSMRPLLLLQYHGVREPIVEPDKLGVALGMANLLLENAVVTAPGPGGFDLIQTDWNDQSATIADAIRAIPQA